MQNVDYDIQKGKGRGRWNINTHTHTKTQEVFSRAKFGHNPGYFMQQDWQHRGKVASKEKSLLPGVWKKMFSQVEWYVGLRRLDIQSSPFLEIKKRVCRRCCRRSVPGIIQHGWHSSFGDLSLFLYTARGFLLFLKKSSRKTCLYLAINM